MNLNYSDCAQSLTGTGNITGNPLFVNGPAYDFNLQAGSPCIDTGDPASPLDPDSTRADMGALYYDHLAPPVLDVTLALSFPPPPPPYINFIASVINNGPTQTPFWVWARIKNPNGTYTNPTLGPMQINPPAGVLVSRPRTFVVPGGWPAGLYHYLGYTNWTFSYPAVDSSWFTFTITTGGNNPFEPVPYTQGEPFPGEEIPPLSRGDRGDLLGDRGDLFPASPNPFNATTAISFKLQDASHVSLKVYDTAGRLVATLVDGWREAGTHKATFEGSGLASGIYLAVFSAENQSQSLKLILLK
jgi:hypothetical protein